MPATRLNECAQSQCIRGTVLTGAFLTARQWVKFIELIRVRMLDFITRAPLDCPVAVVFGHASAMNWAGPPYSRVGLEIASAPSAGGYPADLIPSSLAGTSVLRLDGDGYVCFGPMPLKVRWFDGSLCEVTRPVEPGRHGAYVEGTARDGRKVRRALTFYCHPPHDWETWRNAPIQEE